MATESLTTGDVTKTFRYDKEAMLKIYANNPLSKERPSCLSSEFDQIVVEDENGITKLWKPDLWIQKMWEKEQTEPEHQNQSSNSNSLINTATSTSSNGLVIRPSIRFSTSTHHRSATGSNAENASSNKRLDTLKVESQDGGIVLSPQRRSFGGGCVASAGDAAIGSSSAHRYPNQHAAGRVVVASSAPQQAPTTRPAARRSTSPAGGPQQQHRYSNSNKAMGGGRQPPQHQQQGSCWRDRNARNYQNEYDNRNSQPQRRFVASNGPHANNNEYQQRNAPSSTNSSNANSNYNSAYGYSNQSHHQYHQNNNYRRHEHYSDKEYALTQNLSERDVPEWATEGPLDVHDVIDLHGFDDDVTSSRIDDLPSAPQCDNDIDDAQAQLWAPDVDQKQRGGAKRDGGGGGSDRDANGSDILVNGTLPFEKLLNDAPSGSRFRSFFTGPTSDAENVQSKTKTTNSEYEKRPVIQCDGKANSQAFSQHELLAGATTGGAEKRLSAEALFQNSVANATQRTPLGLQRQDKMDCTKINEKRTSQSPGLKIHAGAMNLEELEAMLCKRPAPEFSSNSSGSTTSKMPNGIDRPKDNSSGKHVLLQDIFKSVEASCSKEENLAHASTTVASMSHTNANAKNHPLAPSGSDDGLSIPSHLATTMVSSRQLKSHASLASINKGKTLSDPDQQQYLIDMLNKLQAQREKQDGGLASDEAANMLNSLSVGNNMSGVPAAFANMPPPPLLNQLGLNALLAQQALMQNPALASAMMLGASGGVATASGGLPPPNPAIAAAAALHQQVGGAAPTPQELMLNAQLAYQKALFNRKLENNLKMQHGDRSGNADYNNMHSAQQPECSTGLFSSSAGSSRPPMTLSSFMPTSVLKQMHGATPKTDAVQNQIKIQLSPTENNSRKQPQQLPSPRQSTGSLAQQQPTTAAPPVDLMRMMQQQQQRQQQFIRLQQHMFMQQQQQQMGPGANMMPPVRLPTNPMPKMGDVEYQQVMAMALLQQQQQQQFRAAAGMDLIRQRAMLAAAAVQQSQHQAALMQQQRGALQRPGPSFLPANPQQAELNARLRQLLLQQSGDVTGNATNVADGSASQQHQMMTLDELERLQKTSSSTNA